jgi:hypothetical protein
MCWSLNSGAYSDRMTEHEGHLFVAHGRIESVIHDAALLPVDSAYRWNRVWRDLVGDRPPLPLDWEGRGFGRVKPAPDRVWAVSTGDGREDYDVILQRIEGALGRVDAHRDSYPMKRGEGSLPLVALPVVGIGLGGFSEDRGNVLRLLVSRLTDAARRLHLDIALVTPDASVYAAAQYARKDVAPHLPARLEELARRMGERARDGELALLLGAGVSAAAGLPTWHRLIQDLAKDFGVVEPDNVTELTPTDRAELIERVADGRFQARIAHRIRAVERPSLLHALLAGLDCHEVVTTNYDGLYEKAVEATQRDITSVMPWASAHGADRWILKLHGDVDHHDKIVLTRKHMVSYDAANRPSAAVLQSLLLTKHLLTIGVSMTDDNVIRLAYEVQAYRQEHQGGGSGAFGTVIDGDGDRLRSQLWDGQLEWVAYEATGLWPYRRGVELLIDRIAFHASRDSSWLLDARFEGLLQDDSDREVARLVRSTYLAIPRREGNKWWPLVRSLERFGATRDSRPIVYSKVDTRNHLIVSAGTGEVLNDTTVIARDVQSAAMYDLADHDLLVEYAEGHGTDLLVPAPGLVPVDTLRGFMAIDMDSGRVHPPSLLRLVDVSILDDVDVEDHEVIRQAAASGVVPAVSPRVHEFEGLPFESRHD